MYLHQPLFIVAALLVFCFLAFPAKAGSTRVRRFLNIWPLYAFIIGFTLFIGLSGPHLADSRPQVEFRPAQIIATIEDSKSLHESRLAPDYSAREISKDMAKAVRFAFGDFVGTRFQDYVGAAVYGRHSIIAAPLEIERKREESITKTFGNEPGMEGSDARAGIDTAISMFATAPDGMDRVLVIAGNGEGAIDASEKARLVKLFETHRIDVYLIVTRGLGGETLKLDLVELVATHAGWGHVFFAPSETAVKLAFTKISLELEPKPIIVSDDPIEFAFPFFFMSGGMALMFAFFLSFAWYQDRKFAK